MVKDYYNPDCPYKDRCSSRGPLCGSCIHNKAKRRDYYEPDNTPWIPPWKYKPMWV